MEKDIAQHVNISASIPITNWRNFDRRNDIQQLALMSHKNRLSEIDLQVQIWSAEIINKYSNFLAQLKLYRKTIAQLQELERIQLLKYENGRLQINELMNTKNQIADIQLKISDINLQLLLFRFEIRSAALFDIKENIKVRL